MDDFVVLAKTRHYFQRTMKKVHGVMRNLKLRLHRQQKCLFSKTNIGFDFLGYQARPNQKFYPSVVSIQRLTDRYRRLYEQRPDLKRVRQYVKRWCCRHWGGLQGRVLREGGVDKVLY